MKKLLVLFIGLFIMVNGAVFAQETDDDDDTDGSQEGYVTGSVSTSVYSAVPLTAEDEKFGLVQPMYSQHGVNSRVGLSWIYNSIFPCGGLIRCEITGHGSSQIVGTVPEITICVRIVSILRNGSDRGNSSQNCLYFTTRGNVSVDYTVKGDPRGAFWTVNTSHIIIGPGIYDNPRLQASVSL